MSTRKTTLFYVVLIAVASMAIGMVIASRFDMAPASSAEPMIVPAANSAPITGPIDAVTFRNIAKAQTPMVVNIRTESRRRTQELTDSFGLDDFLRRFGSPDFQHPRRPREDVTEAAGTGFVIDKAGLILTNNHVVEGATKIEVGLYGDEDGTVYKAKVIGRDPLTDSALIELTEKPNHTLPEAKFGDSSEMQPGDWVMAIGNPFNQAFTVTVGVISAIGRPFNVAEGRWQNMLQTDAAINPGNSGGPLLNVRGEVVGVNTAILAGERAPANLGIGFAIPINAVRELLPQLRQGKVIRGRLGITVLNIPANAVEQFGLKSRQGAVVSEVQPNTAASRGGMQPGDVVIEYNGKPVQNRDDLVERVKATTPGTAVPVKVIRNKQTKTLSVTIEELDLEAEGGPRMVPDDSPETGFGVSLQDLSPEMARRLRLPGGNAGALITDVEPRSAAARAGVQPNDVLLEVNRKPVTSASEAARELQQVKSGDVAFLLVWSRGSERFITITKE
ncbi:MAG: trypsin-like peptidase domain-containing protein [Acidobacteria bacterium]|nr:trypsin-like peptidase domain-containing protein [Acidobacteriota bacterium]